MFTKEQKAVEAWERKWGVQFEAGRGMAVWGPDSEGAVDG